MLNLTDITLKAVATHFVGNKSIGDELLLSDNEVIIKDDTHRVQLLQFFFGPFTEQETYQFCHASDLEQNEVYKMAKAFFEHDFFEHLPFFSLSKRIAKHLYEAMNLPNVSGGELHICHFEIPVNGTITDAIGIYKTGRRENFVQLYETTARYDFEFKEGLVIGNAVLIYNTQAETGYKLHILKNAKDKSNFWMDTFLKVAFVNDDYHKTATQIKIAKDFINEQIPCDFETTSVEQIDLLRKTATFFKKNEDFDKELFEKEVFQQPEVIASFRKYQKQFSEDYEVEIPEQFEINTAAVKKQTARMKSVLKLDKNFHVYVHGDKDLIEKGYSTELGMNYYKIYFEEEK